jgi:hypothetical protein
VSLRRAASAGAEQPSCGHCQPDHVAAAMAHPVDRSAYRRTQTRRGRRSCGRLASASFGSWRTFRRSVRLLPKWREIARSRRSIPPTVGGPSLPAFGASAGRTPPFPGNPACSNSHFDGAFASQLCSVFPPKRLRPMRRQGLAIRPHFTRGATSRFLRRARNWPPQSPPLS